MLKQTYGSNASDVIKAVKEKLDDLRKKLVPSGDDIRASATTYRTSLMLLLKTLFIHLRDAFILVALVVFVDSLATGDLLRPTLAVPISLIGAFIFMQLFGLTINTDHALRPRTRDRYRGG